MPSGSSYGGVYVNNSGSSSSTSTKSTSSSSSGPSYTTYKTADGQTVYVTKTATGSTSSLTPPGSSPASQPSQPVLQQPKSVSTSTSTQDNRTFVTTPSGERVAIGVTSGLKYPTTEQTIQFNLAPGKETTTQSGKLFSGQRDWESKFIKPATNVPAEQTAYGITKSFVNERQNIIQQKLTRLPQTFILAGGKTGYSLSGGIYTETGEAINVGTPAQYVSKVTSYGALSSMTDITRLNKPAVELIGIGKTEGASFKFGQDITSLQKSTLQFETSSLFAPKEINIDVASLSKGKIFNANIFKEVGLYKAESSQLTKPVFFGRVSTTTTQGDVFTTVGQFFNEKLATSTFGTRGRLVGLDEFGLKSYSSITAQEGFSGRNFLIGARTRETSIFNLPSGLERTNYNAISAISTKKLPEISIQTVGREANIPKIIETPSGSQNNIFNIFKSKSFNLVKEQPIIEIQNVLTAQLGRENYLLNVLPKTTGYVVGFVEQAKRMKKEPVIIQTTSKTQGITIPSIKITPQSVLQSNPQFVNQRIVTTQSSQSLQTFLTQTPQTQILQTPFVSQGSPIPSVFPGPVIAPIWFPVNIGLSGRQGQPSNFWKNIAKYTPSFRGLNLGVIGRTPGRAGFSGYYIGTEIRGIPEELARSLGIKTTTRRRRKK